MSKVKTNAVAPIERIAHCVYLIQGHKVMLDMHTQDKHDLDGQMCTSDRRSRAPRACSVPSAPSSSITP